MRQHPQARRTLLSVLIATLVLPPASWAEQLSLAQYPAGSSSRQPAPNVIVTLDDSGSMGYYSGGGTKQDETKTTSRMYALKTALRTLFDATAQNIPDGSIRLAWNTLNNCRSIPSSTGGCAGLNHMRVLDATHRANFLNWVGTPGVKSSSKLTATGSTPTHQAYIAVGDYLANGSPTAVESPWANVPGVSAGNPVLSCRKSYSVLMTDGGWNFEFKTHGTDVARPKDNSDLDRTSVTLPDGTLYDKNSAQTAVYRGVGGRSFTYNGNTVRVSTLADLAFHYWATDLAPGLSNDVLPRTKQSGNQTFTSGLLSSVTLTPYWNPRNDPATWQHLNTYTIGFGDAARWKTTVTFAGYPAWDTATNDTYGGDLPSLITGARSWPDPMVNNSVTLTESTSALNLDALTTNGEARKTELWHMAINSRGKFIASTDAASLVAAFREIFSEIIADSSTPVAGYANASASIARNPTTQYTAGYTASAERNGELFTWMGYVRADTVSQNAETGAVSTTPAAGWDPSNSTPAASVTTADKLDALAATAIPNRLILTWSDASPGGGPTSFQWTQDASPSLPALSTAQKNLFRAEGAGTLAETVAEQRLKFIRGDTSQDGLTFNGTQFRKRGSRQGDTVNSVLWYVADPVSNYAFDKYSLFAAKHAKRLPMVYVGANDGMLHGFSGRDGSEKIAYVPRGVMANLADLTRSTYGHRYYVDGSPLSGDVNWGNATTPDWRTLLVGALGAGGKGYFVLDVTNPGTTATDNTGQASNFAKANAATLVVMDKTAASSESLPTGDERLDIGHITAAPVVEDGNAQKTTQIVRMNNGRWAVVMGNGYNSTNERPVLLVQYLDGDKSLLRIPAATTGTNASSNGLSAPRLLDIDGNGTPDVVYAGDLRGNLWKFNVSAASSASWGVAFSGSPLYTAAHISGSVSTPQPITAPPIVRANQRGARGLMVAFATGRNLTEADRTDVSVQSIYSVLDETQYKIESGKVVVDGSPTPLGTGYANLVQQSVDATEVAGEGSSSARTFWTISQNDVPYTDDGAKKGWYLNLPQEGERVLAQMSFYDASNIIELITEVPASGGTTAEESCLPPSTQVRKYRTLLNIMDGKAPSVQVMDTNGDGYYNADDGGTSRMTASATENGVMTHKEQIRKGSDNTTDKLRRLPEIPLRPNWRQLQ